MTNASRSWSRPGAARGSTARSRSNICRSAAGRCCAMRSMPCAGIRGVAAVRVVYPSRGSRRSMTRRSPGSISWRRWRAARRGRIRCGSASRAWPRIAPDRVLIHDAARPVRRCRDDRPGAGRARRRAGRDPCRADQRHGEARRRRASWPRRWTAPALWRAQTPQGFRYRRDPRGASRRGGAAICPTMPRSPSAPGLRSGSSPAARPISR